MFLDHSELWIWRAVQGWERKTGDRTLAWQTEGPRSILQKEKKTALMSSINVCGGSGSLKRALSVEGTWWCKGNHEKARQGHLLHTHCGSPAPGSLTGDHRNYLRCLFRGRTKASATTSITVTWVCLKEDRRKSSCWPDDPEALWHLLQSCTGDRETDSGK